MSLEPQASIQNESHLKRNWRAWIASFCRREDAIAITEYGMLVALVAVLLIVVVTVFGSQISSWFSARTGAIITV